MKTTSEILLKNISQRTTSILNRVEKLQTASDQKLNHKSNPDKWSVLECIEHLNLYADYYNPAIKKSLKNNTSKPKEKFKGSWFGNYFEKSMLPKEKLNAMGTFKDKNPSGSNLDKTVLEKFIRQQKEILQLIEESKKVTISKTKIPITISKFIKLSLGDTFRFNIAHIERHVLQAEKALHL